MHNGDGLISPHEATWNEVAEAAAGGTSMGPQDVLYAWRDFECSSFAAALMCPRAPFRRFLIREAHSVEAGVAPRRDIGGDDAAHDFGVALSSLALLRRLSTGVPARGVSGQRHSAALGQHERGSRSVPALGGVPVAARTPGTGPAKTAHKPRSQISIMPDGEHTETVLLPLDVDPRCRRRIARASRSASICLRRCPRRATTNRRWSRRWRRPVARVVATRRFPPRRKQGAADCLEGSQHRLDRRCAVSRGHHDLLAQQSLSAARTMPATEQDATMNTNYVRTWRTASVRRPGAADRTGACAAAGTGRRALLERVRRAAGSSSFPSTRRCSRGATSSSAKSTIGIAPGAGNHSTSRLTKRTW